MTKVAKYAGINASNDGPSVILNATKGDFSSAQVTQYFVESKYLKGAIIPSANFEPLPIAISAERTAVPLAHVAHNSVQRTLRMDDDRFSGLPRYLTADTNKNGLSFGTKEDSVFSVYAENVDLANPVSMDGSAVEGDIEDTGSNLPRIAERLNRSASNILDLYSMELLHASQAADLRKTQQTNVKLSDKTQALYDTYRAKVPSPRYPADDEIRVFATSGISSLRQPPALRLPYRCCRYSHRTRFSFRLVISHVRFCGLFYGGNFLGIAPHWSLCRPIRQSIFCRTLLVVPAPAAGAAFSTDNRVAVTMIQCLIGLL